MEPYAMIQVSILLSVVYQIGKNVTSMFDFYVSAETLATTCGPLRFRGPRLKNAALQNYIQFMCSLDQGSRCVSFNVHVVIKTYQTNVIHGFNYTITRLHAHHVIALLGGLKSRM